MIAFVLRSGRVFVEDSDAENFAQIWLSGIPDSDNFVVTVETTILVLQMIW